jgi:hypothetical protein
MPWPRQSAETRTFSRSWSPAIATVASERYRASVRATSISIALGDCHPDAVEKANAHTDLEMARAIYNHVISTVKYDKTGKGWGRGDIYYACRERRGNCTDFHAIFIGYPRAVGIPARFAIGFPLPADRGEGKIDGYHCWAEFYARGIGWIPVDASEAAKNPAKRQYFFGAHDENRLEFTKGRDLMLAPRQKGDSLNYFIYRYAEVDGRPVSEAAYVIVYRDSGSWQAAALVGQVGNLRPIVNRPARDEVQSTSRPIDNRPQVLNLPHKLSRDPCLV